VRGGEREAYDDALDAGRDAPRCRVCEGGRAEPCCEQCATLARIKDAGPGWRSAEERRLRSIANTRRNIDASRRMR